MSLSNQVARAALILAVAGGAALIPGVASAAPPVIVADPTRPSAIAISDGSTYLLNSSGSMFDVACVAFVNHGPRTATKVGLNLAYLDATGTVLGVDFIYPSGKFFVDKRSAFSGGRGGMETPNANCHATNVNRKPFTTTFDYKPGKTAAPVDVAAILVSAREIVYDDGTAWRSDQVPQMGDRLALPSPAPFAPAVPAGPPLFSTAKVNGSPLDVTDAFTYESVSQEYAGRIPYIARSRSTCVGFVNHDARPAKHARIDLELVDRNGTVAGIEEIHPRGTFSQDISIFAGSGACISLKGKLDGDTFLYTGGAGDPVAIGRIVAVPVLEEFADGTAWQSPSPPKIGDKL
ncbi:MAG TPA: hypothetical protein VGD01_18490 [Candidatus Elarobacter sp.]